MSEQNRPSKIERVIESHKQEVRRAIEMWLDKPNSATYDNLQLTISGYNLLYLDRNN